MLLISNVEPHRFINPIMHGQRHDATRREVALGRIAAFKFSKVIRKLILRRDKTLIQDKVRLFISEGGFV